MKFFRIYSIRLCEQNIIIHLDRKRKISKIKFTGIKFWLLLKFGYGITTEISRTAEIGLLNRRQKKIGGGGKKYIFDG